MGGEIGVNSQLGAGSTFYFCLPLEAAPPMDAITEGSSNPVAEKSPSRDTVRILVAEDTEDNRLLLTHYLRGEPVQLHFANDGQDAINSILSGDEFDLILMDIDMPGLDGYEATKFIRDWQRTHGDVLTPIVALSAHAMRQAEQASLAAGCVAHVAKPVDQATLLCVIRRYAHSKRVCRPERAVIAEGVEALVPKYLASKPRQIDEARACLASKNFEPIQRFGHNLMGTGRGYGFPPIEEMGREIEKAAAQRDEAGIAEQLEALHRFVIDDQPSRVRLHLRPQPPA
jgi:CheY-like chemotaxis protein